MSFFARMRVSNIWDRMSYSLKGFLSQMQEKMQSFHMCGQKIVKMSNRAHLISYCTSFILLLDCFHMHQCTTYFLTNPIIKHFPFYLLFGNTYKVSELRSCKNLLKSIASTVLEYRFAKELLYHNVFKVIKILSYLHRWYRWSHSVLHFYI